MGPIITVTPHTAIDNVLEVDAFRLGDTRALASDLFASGKGVNVGRVVATLGHPTVITGFVGRLWTPLFRELRSELLAVDLVEVDGPTRMNLTITEVARNSAMHIQTKGPRIAKEDFLRLREKLEDTVQRADVVVLAGSLPNGTAPEAYKDLVELCKHLCERVVFDSSGACLKEGVAGVPYIIKPNVDELAELAGQRLVSEAAIVSVARKLVERGIAAVVVTRGADGLLLIQRDTNSTLRARVDVDAPAAHAVGSGDACIAGFVVGLGEREAEDWEEAVRLGTACGAANVLTRAPGVVDPHIVEDLKKAVVVEEIHVG